jgi:hypothetical protein
VHLKIRPQAAGIQRRPVPLLFEVHAKKNVVAQRVVEDEGDLRRISKREGLRKRDEMKVEAVTSERGTCKLTKGKVIRSNTTRCDFTKT